MYNIVVYIIVMKMIWRGKFLSVFIFDEIDLENWELGEIILMFVDVKVGLVVLFVGFEFCVMLVFVDNGILLVLIWLLLIMLGIVEEFVLVVVVVGILLFLDDLILEIEILVSGLVENVRGVFFDWMVVLDLRSIFVEFICISLKY